MAKGAPRIPKDPEFIEYRVVPVQRYMVTRYSREESAKASDFIVASHRSIGTLYDQPNVAHEVASALARAEHERLGWPPGDERIRYPIYEPESFAAADGKSRLYATED